MTTEADILTWLEAVTDPEIPTVSLVDLGVIREVRVQADGSVHVRLTPTFAGCPAMDYMRRDVETTLRAHGVPHVTTEISLQEPWTSDMVTERGLEGLRRHGLATPPKLDGALLDLDILEYAECPRCHQHNTELRTPFGATLCRAVHYCHNCRQLFEQFKPV
ncbi:1,2-phenylacetyl-CoA epoxidase subunit PaaD [Hymenobacter weizhouensis]|uniref:1,2-phenylacetyl-CoA epoxidase subunit PaaD n=1 Tax=Hymenobacter sp. YIM 151500-1 TaxID=2987689 RepID=UPI002227D4D3|nr:1,2-phenylacetyl-CoA epoxidase subunit PaaD [Hymenobacter sp. YIM 151500-1]UYZ63676.1 phenylacetate-CoA oxygenase subunit PaaJ [Hymenobacter sp. YIM 151500-1]